MALLSQPSMAEKIDYYGDGQGLLPDPKNPWFDQSLRSSDGAIQSDNIITIYGPMLSDPINGTFNVYGGYLTGLPNAEITGNNVILKEGVVINGFIFGGGAADSDETVVSDNTVTIGDYAIVERSIYTAFGASKDNGTGIVRSSVAGNKVTLGYGSHVKGHV